MDIQKHLTILELFFDDTKSNTQIATEIKQNGKWNYPNEYGRKIVAEYRKSINRNDPEMIETLEELIDYQGIDTTKYQVKSFSVSKTSRGKISIQSRFSPTQDIDFKEGIKELLDSYVGIKFPKLVCKVEPTKKKVDNLLIINIFDAHFGKVGDKDLTGEDYNLETAKNLFLDCVYSIAREAHYDKGIEEVVLCTGGDFFHTDTTTYTTTSGTNVTSDGNTYQKIFKEGCDAIIKSLMFLEGMFKKVTFININGNHDRQTSYYMGEVVSTFFRESKIVNIDNSPSLRKYYSFGDNAFQFSHGDKAIDRLPLIFATEHKEFSLKKFRHSFVGHLHHSSKKFYVGETETNGISLRVCNSISATDTYHHDEGWTNSIRKADGLIYSKKYGKIAEINHVVSS